MTFSNINKHGDATFSGSAAITDGTHACRTRTVLCRRYPGRRINVTYLLLVTCTGWAKLSDTTLHFCL